MDSSDEDDFEDDSLCKYGAQLPQFEAGLNNSFLV